MANLPPVSRTLSKEERYQTINYAKRELIDRFVRQEPPDWRLPATVALRNYGEAWVNEILPVAREAHERLRFTNVHSQLDQDRVVMGGEAREKPAPDGVSYADWTVKIVHEELHKAGWRLADLLTQALTSASISAKSAPGSSASVSLQSSTPLETLSAPPAPITSPSAFASAARSSATTPRITRRSLSPG